MSDSINAYLQEIGRHPVLSKTAQLTHARHVHAWLNHPDGENVPRRIKSRGQRSMDALVRTNLRLVVTVAKKYQNRGLDMSDLIQEGSLGLIRGLELYDPSRGYALSTYVYWWIRQSITRACVNTGRSIRLPIHTHELLYKISAERALYFQLHQRQPTLEELAELIGVKLSKLQDAVDISASTFCCSYDIPLDGDDETLLYYLTDHDDELPIEAVDRAIELEQLNNAINSLDPDDRTIVNQRIYDRCSFNEIAKRNGITTSQARHTYAMAVNQLKVYFYVRRLNAVPSAGSERLQVAC